MQHSIRSTVYGLMSMVSSPPTTHRIRFWRRGAAPLPSAPSCLPPGPESSNGTSSQARMLLSSDFEVRRGFASGRLQEPDHPPPRRLPRPRRSGSVRQGVACGAGLVSAPHATTQPGTDLTRKISAEMCRHALRRDHSLHTPAPAARQLHHSLTLVATW